MSGFADLARYRDTTFERALAAIDRFRPSGGGMLAWLLRIARNAHLDTLRRREWRTSSTEATIESADRSHAGPEDGAVLRGLIADLPATQRDAIQLRFAAGLTAREIGVVLGMSEGATQKQLERALAALKEAYRAD